MTNTFDIESYIGPVGKKELAQFKKAAANPATRFEDELALHLYDVEAYYPLADRKEVAGRNHLSAMAVNEGSAKLGEQSFFANCLQVATGETGPDGKTVYPSPSKRVILGPLAIYTFEFDVADIAFFRTQLSWLRSKGKKPVDCPMGQFFKTCSQWTDFKGLTVCWSGHKSLHIHAVFDTAPYLARFASPGGAARHGMMAHWDKLEAALIADLGLTDYPQRPDRSLRRPEQYRRLPNGLREIDKPGHLLGIPVGTIVPQLTLWEMWRGCTSRNAKTLFHSPTLFARQPVRPTKVARKHPENVGPLSPTEIAHCESRLRDAYPNDSWPRLSHLGFDSGQWKAWFFNCEGDANPNSVMCEDYCTILMQGHGADLIKPAPLPATLGECIREWLGEIAPEVETDEDVVASVKIGGSELERAFAGTATKATASSAIDAQLPKTMLFKRWLLLQGPEGASKTSTIMRHHPWIVHHLGRVDESHSILPRQSLYAFGSYSEAQAKCADFNQLHASSEYVGIVLQSFSAAYGDACAAKGLVPLMREWAAQKGYPSLWRAINDYQPDVVAELERQHLLRWQQIGNRQPVWFSVHQVAHSWHQSTLTRLMAAPSYWSAQESRRTETCREETRLSILIHDEIKASTFVDMTPDAIKSWIDALRASAPAAWSDLALDQREMAYQRQCATHSPPEGLDFNTASKLASVDAWKQVITQDTGEYAAKSGDQDIYASRHGNVWSISPRNWWREVDALRVVFLTTEEMPTAVAETTEPNLVTLRLDAPLIAPDVLDVHPKRGVTSKNLPAVIEEWRAAKGDDWFAVSNKLHGEADSLSHARARGSNELIGKKIVQTMTFMHPVEYEQMQALNAWTGRDDLVLLRHIDECNQTAGRNLGFRLRPGAEHALLINPGLLRLIEPALGYSRYGFRIHETPNQRRTIKRKMAVQRGVCGETPANQANDNGGEECDADKDREAS